MSLALCKSPVGATASRPHRGQQFLCRSPQMIRMIHWYRNPKQLGPGSAEASWTESCLVMPCLKLLPVTMAFFRDRNRQQSEAIVQSAFVQLSGISSDVHSCLLYTSPSPRD